ncbi:MAG: hypothetical protein ACRC1D_02915 [Culicoidibacterales bacterium]
MKNQDTALRLIKDAGQKLFFQRLTSNNLDPVLGTNNNLIQADEFTVVVLPGSKKDFEIYLEDGIRTDQVRFLLVAAKDAPFELRGGDQCNFENKLWVVMGCTPLNPAGIPIIYKVGMKLV